MVCIKILSVLATVLAASSAYTVDPPTTAPSNTITDCTNWVVVASGDTCTALASANGITLAQFDKYNPSVGSKCVFIIGDSYCVEENFGIPPVTTTSTKRVTTKTGNGVTTPGPIQTGMIGSCNKFYLVASGDECATIASAHSISLANFYLWNPAVGSTCTRLIAADYVCIGVIGTTSHITSTKSGNGISTPGPVQTGIVSNCNTFHLVVSGDECATIAVKFGISLTHFYAWNPAVGSTCSTLVLGDYVCVNVVGGSTLPSITATSISTNGVSTPSPIQTGMVTTCDSFYLVVSGDQCGTIASSHGISLAQFYLWNPAVGSSCGTLGLGDYVCVNILGGTTLTTRTITTMTGNGITTPTPIQTGMVGNCNTFYLVMSGDQCGTIASSHGISLANFYLWNPAVGSSCATLGLGDYVCVNVVGGTTTTSLKATSTSPGNGVTTPTPYQAGMTTSCKTFHLVVSGDECGLIASAAGIALATFYSWNPAVGSTCATLGLGYYVCVGSL